MASNDTQFGHYVAKDPPVDSGEIIAGRYKVLKTLGSGGMGEVLLVSDLALEGELVALKRLYAQVASNPRLVARFRNEVLLARKLSHPNIVRIYDFGQTGPTDYYISMEYVEGQSLYDVVYEGPQILSIGQIASLLVPICSALSYSHSRQVVHRDLKPDNILITKDGQIKITDFGIARSLEENKGLTATNEVVGTAYYMSPEQFRGSGVDGRSDIYSLGIMAYEMATRERPFNNDNALAIAALHFSEELPRMNKINPNVPGWFQDFVDTCCEKDPANRFQNMQEVAEILLECCPKEDRPQSSFDFVLGGARKKSKTIAETLMHFLGKS